jgi:hypothetical protein
VRLTGVDSEHDSNERRNRDDPFPFLESRRLSSVLGRPCKVPDIRSSCTVPFAGSRCGDLVQFTRQPFRSSWQKRADRDLSCVCRKSTRPGHRTGGGRPKVCGGLCSLNTNKATTQYCPPSVVPGLSPFQFFQFHVCLLLT